MVYPSLQTGRRALLPALFTLLLAPAGAARALDVFTLWRQPMIPLRLEEGAWTDYRTETWIGGRRSVDLLRIQCVGTTGVAADPSWQVEMLPLVETPGGLVPIEGDGLQLQLSGRILRREGELTEVVERVVRWEGGQATELSPSQWRDDPFVSSSLQAEFRPELSQMTGRSTRVVGGRSLACDQFEMSAADTQRVTLPRGVLEQVSRREVTAEINGAVPFLGIAYAAERTQSHSRLDPPSDRFPLPAPIMEVDTMELVDFGDGAVARFKSR